MMVGRAMEPGIPARESVKKIMYGVLTVLIAMLVSTDGSPNALARRIAEVVAPKACAEVAHTHGLLLTYAD
jgi:hypothetical protein